jgi:hypothetical protein
MPNPSGPRSLLLCAVAVAWLATAGVAGAAVIPVTSCLDDGVGTTLRAAINAAGFQDVLVVPACTIVLTGAAGNDNNASGDLDVAGFKSITIVGAGPARTIVDGGSIDRVFHTQPGASLTLVGLTIRNGNVGVSGGGGIKHEAGGTLFLTNVALVGNQTTGTGGGLHSFGSATLTNVTVSGNAGGTVGGVAHAGPGMVLTNVLVADNTATFSVGGVSHAIGTSTLNNVIIAGNVANGGVAGGLGVSTGTVNLRGTVIARNASTGGNPDCQNTANLNSHGHNVIGVNCGIALGTTDVAAAAPLVFGDLIVGTGAGGGPQVRVIDPHTGADVIFPFFAYDPGFLGGVRVAACDINTDGVPDIVTAAGVGGGPHVAVRDGVTGALLPGPLGGFFPYDPGYLGGVYVACMDADRDGVPDVVTGTGAGGGAHVRIFSGRDGSEIFGSIVFPPGFLGGAFVGGR